MRYAWILISCMLVVGCVAPPSEWPRNVVDAGQPSVTSETVILSQIGGNRKKVSYELRNLGKRDAFCDSVSFRVILDDPNSYLELGEQVYIVEKLFLRANEAIKGTLPVAAPQEVGHWHVRAVDAYRGSEACRGAGFVDYCDYAERTAAEGAFLALLFEQSEAATCEALHSWYENVEFVDLRNFPSFSIRPLVYLKGPSRLVVRESSDALSFVRRFEQERYSNWVPTVLVESRDCERPAGVEDRLPPRECLVSGMEEVPGKE